jgi:hypothetical protein
MRIIRNIRRIFSLKTYRKKGERGQAPPIRVWTNRELKRIAPLFPGTVVNVSGWEDEDKEGGHYRDYFTSCSSYFITNYSIGHRYSGTGLKEVELDLAKHLPDELRESVDVVFNHTTLEHIFDVNRAFENLCSMTRDIVIVVVPFIQQQHEAPQYNFRDYWRFTPSCLRELFRRNDMDVVYEACNNQPHVINYLFFTGSKHPSRWKKKMPNYRELNQIGPWVR